MSVIDARPSMLSDVSAPRAISSGARATCARWFSISTVRSSSTSQTLILSAASHAAASVGILGAQVDGESTSTQSSGDGL